MSELTAHPLILVDDEEQALETESLIMELNGYTNVHTCNCGEKALERLAEFPDAVVVLDVTMPGRNGIEILGSITMQYPDALVIMLTGLNHAETAVTCMKSGAFDYIVKPIDQSRLLTSVGKALDHKEIINENRRLRDGMLTSEVESPEAFNHIVTVDEKCRAIFRYIEAIAPSGLPILITGETGTGKELFAHAVHLASGRKGEFVCVNTAGIDDTLFSDTLFGHEQGAFTGAIKSRPGLIDRGGQGTLFLDEIGDMRPESQVKLLRLLQDGTYYRLGSEVEHSSSARIIAATNRSLEELQKAGAFRKDLFYRLKAHHVHLPPLRERKGDIPLLLDHFLLVAAQEQQKNKPTPARELVPILCNYEFPGNIRELQGMVYDAVGQHNGGVLSCGTFRNAVGLQRKSGGGTADNACNEETELSFPPTLPTARAMELRLVREAFMRSGGNRKLAAEMIQMSRQTFANKLRELGIE